MTDSLNFCLILYYQFLLYCSEEQIVKCETRDSGEKNKMKFLYRGHSYKEDSEYLGCCV